MPPSDDTVSPEPGASDAAAPRRSTLTPPEWVDRSPPKSVSVIALQAKGTEAPISRFSGPRAEEAHLRAAIAAARASGDGAAERRGSIAVARLLASRSAEPRLAIDLASRALELADDPELRSEVATWLAGLGEPANAAAMLEPLVESQAGAEAARLLVRVGVHLARANVPTGARDAFERAGDLDPTDPVPLELLGTLAAWSQGEIAPEVAAKAYLDGAGRRERRGEKEAAFEDLLRAFEAAPAWSPAAERLAAVLVARGRAGAADEVLRAHASALPAKAADGASPRRAAHLARFATAVEAGDVARALGAALDAGLDGSVDGSEAERFDDLLSRAGLFEPLAARLEWRAETASGARRAKTLAGLARLYAGPLASPDRAIETWIEALAADPACEEARSGLRTHAAATYDQAPLVEALVRASSTTDEPSRAGRVACLRELATLAEERLGDPGLAQWATRRLEEEGVGDEAVRAARVRLEARVHLQDDALASARAQLAGLEGIARVEPLRRIASILRGRPDQAPALAGALCELVSLVKGDRSWSTALARLQWRLGDLDGLTITMRAVAEDAPTRADLVRARLALADVAVRQGDLARALDEVKPLLAEASGHRAAASHALVLAARVADPRARAEAIEQLAAPLAPAQRAVLLSVAAEARMAADDVPGARASAEKACHADPTLARAVGQLAAIAAHARDRVGAAAIERAVGVVVPRGELCEALAAMHEADGKHALALAWTQRWLALRPGDPRAIGELVRRAAAAGDAARLGDALAWVLSQPEPLGNLAGERLALALRSLHELDAARGVALAHRALDVFGPRVAPLREAIADIADIAGDRPLGVAVLERWLAAPETPEAERADRLLALADRRRDLGDAAGEMRALSRAFEAGAPAARVLARLPARPSGSSDAQLAWLEARSLALASQGEPSRADAVRALRELGAARWDLADDPAGASQAWIAASRLDPAKGYGKLAKDLVSFGGAELAYATMVGLADPRADAADAAEALVTAAGIALEHGNPDWALSAVDQATALAPRKTDALAIAEHASDAAGNSEVLDGIYHRVARAALGVYGRRAAHYRGARQLERRGRSDLALVHAVGAFEAVPSEGMAFVLLSRIAERSGNPAEAVRAVERVASAASDPDVRSEWLKRAAMLAGSGVEGTRQRVEVLLRALLVRPDVQTVEALSRDATSLIADSPDELTEMRVSRAWKTVLPRLDGPEGARVAVAIALAALTSFGAVPLACAALARAVEADGDIDEYLQLLPRAARIAEDREEAQALAHRVELAAKKPYSSIGPSVLRLASAIADALADPALATALIVEAARRAPDDDALVREADAYVSRSGDERLRAQLSEALPVARRIEALLHLASDAEATDKGAAISALERALSLAEISSDDRRGVVARLRGLYGATGRDEALLALLEREAEQVDLEPAERLSLSRELARMLAGRGDLSRAFDVLSSASRVAPTDAALLGELADMARKLGDAARLAEVLARIADLAQAPVARLAILRELAPLLERLGDRATAILRFDEVARLDPRDRDALAALERDASDRGDAETLATLLARRAAISEAKDEVRMLRLRRAALLEQRLGRLDEARAELVTLLGEIGDDAGAIRFLADLHERLGAPAQAAPLWLRAAGLSERPTDRAELAARACSAYLAGGDVASARLSLDSMADGGRDEQLLGMRVEIERRSGDPGRLADALDRLATASHDSPEKRADLLLEAARASIAAGEPAGALERADRAAQLAPSSVEAQLFARLSEYRARGGGGTPTEARRTIDELAKLSGHLEPEQAALRAFLLAEAYDVVQGGGAGMRELSSKHAEIGPLPLIALGLAERLVASAAHAAAVPLFERALAGDVLGLRKKGQIALATAEAAARSGDVERARQYLEEAAADPDTRPQALRRQAELGAAHGDVAGARAALVDLAERAVGTERARVLAQLARLVAAGGEPADRARASDLLLEAIGAVVTDPMLRAELESERAALLAPPVESSRPPPVAATPTPLPPVAVTFPSTPAPPPTQEPPVPPPARDLPPEPAVDSAPAFELVARTGSSSQSIRAVSALRTPLPPPIEAPGRAHSSRPAPPPPPPVDTHDEEGALLAALVQGSFDSGERLARMYDGDPSRARDLVAVRRTQATLVPGDRGVLSRLRDAALADRDHVYARALDHALRAFDPGAGPLPPPPLASQPEAPDHLAALLFKSASIPSLEAFGLVCEGAPHLFRRDLASYGKSGVERVPLGSRAPVGRVYTLAARLLGLARVPLFFGRAPAPLSASVALVSPPAAILSGDVAEETPELRYLIGATLAAAMPECALLSGLPEERARSLFSAILAAYGPPELAAGTGPTVATLAETLWQSLPPRADRRMRELCAAPDGEPHTFESAAWSARRLARRAGLFVAGDLAVAVRRAVAEERLTLRQDLTVPTGLAAACADHPEVADLVRLASSAEFAAARWQPASSERQRPGFSSSTFRPGS